MIGEPPEDSSTETTPSSVVTPTILSPALALGARPQPAPSTPPATGSPSIVKSLNDTTPVISIGSAAGAPSVSPSRRQPWRQNGAAVASVVVSPAGNGPR